MKLINVLIGLIITLTILFLIALVQIYQLFNKIKSLKHAIKNMSCYSATCVKLRTSLSKK